MGDDASEHYGEIKVRKEVLLGLLIGLILISLGLAFLKAKPFSLIMLCLGGIIALISCAVNVLVQARWLSSINGEDYLKAASIIILVLIGAGLLFFQIPFLLHIEFPMDLPAIFVIPPPYSPHWLPVIDGVILDGETAKVLGLAVVGMSLGFLLARRYVRPLSLAFSALFLWHLKFIVEVHPGDHELIRPYVLIALLLVGFIATFAFLYLLRLKEGWC